MISCVEKWSRSTRLNWRLHCAWRCGECTFCPQMTCSTLLILDSYWKYLATEFFLFELALYVTCVFSSWKSTLTFIYTARCSRSWSYAVVYHLEKSSFKSAAKWVLTDRKLEKHTCKYQNVRVGICYVSVCKSNDFMQETSLCSGCLCVCSPLPVPHAHTGGRWCWCSA